MQVEDGWVDAMDCIGPRYLTFIVFKVLCPRGIVVIYSFTLDYIYDPIVDESSYHVLISFCISRVEVS
jgi:hypothetical protein